MVEKYAKVLFPDFFYGMRYSCRGVHCTTRLKIVFIAVKHHFSESANDVKTFVIVVYAGLWILFTEKYVEHRATGVYWRIFFIKNRMAVCSRKY